MTVFAYRNKVLAIDGRQLTGNGTVVLTDTVQKLRYTSAPGVSMVWAYCGSTDQKLVVEDFLKAGNFSKRPPEGDDYEVLGAAKFDGRSDWNMMRFTNHFVRATFDCDRGAFYGSDYRVDGILMAGLNAVETVGVMSANVTYCGPVVYYTDIDASFAAGCLIQHAKRYYKNDRGVLCSAACELDGTPLGGKRDQLDLFEPRKSKVIAGLEEAVRHAKGVHVAELTNQQWVDPPEAFHTDEVAALCRAEQTMGG